MPFFAFPTKMHCHDTFLVLVSTMAYLNNDQKRNEYTKVIQYKSAAECLISQGIKPFVSADVLDYRPYPQIESEFRKHTMHGYISGKILLLLYWMHKTGKDISLNKAFDMVLSISIRSELGSVGLSRTSLKGYWKNYRNISPYFAAAKIVMIEQNTVDIHCCESLLSEMLCVGDYFRHFGENHYIGKDHTRISILDPNQTWRHPENIKVDRLDDIPFLLDPEDLLEKIYARKS